MDLGSDFGYFDWLTFIVYRHVLNSMILFYVFLLYFRIQLLLSELCLFWLGARGGIRSLLDLRCPS